MKRLILFSMILSGVCSDCAVAGNLTPAQRAALYAKRRHAERQAAKAQIDELQMTLDKEREKGQNLERRLTALERQLAANTSTPVYLGPVVPQEVAQYQANPAQPNRMDNLEARMDRIETNAKSAIDIINGNFDQQAQELENIKQRQDKNESVLGRMFNFITTVLPLSASNTPDQPKALVPAGSQALIPTRPQEIALAQPEPQPISKAENAREGAKKVLTTISNAAGATLGATLDGLNGVPYNPNANLKEKFAYSAGAFTLLAAKTTGQCISAICNVAYNASQVVVAKASERKKAEAEAAAVEPATAEAAAVEAAATEAAAAAAATPTPLESEGRKKAAKRKRAEEENTSPPQRKRAKTKHSVGVELKFEDTDVAQKWEQVIHANGQTIKPCITALIDTIPDMSDSDKRTLREIARNLKDNTTRKYQRKAAALLLDELLMAD